MEYLSGLNPVQKQAVEQTEGPVMVIAGAGSGKTRVLTYRIAHLINKGVDAFNILSLTFTNKAAREMKERIGALAGNEARNLWMGTFHSVFARILRSEAGQLGYNSNFTIYDSDDSKKVISSIIKELKLDTDSYKPKTIQGRISAFKNNLITVKSYKSNQELQGQDAAAQRPKTGEIYEMYVQRCFKASAMDFDDLLLKTNELFHRFPETLAKYQQRFKYVMVDEYQDTNHSQYLIVKALASRSENLCVVGDDAQSIYAFRGANIRNILNFQKDYADAKLFKLEQNYRSTKNIVNAANSIIKHNTEQLDKNVWTDNKEGAKIQVYRAFSDNDEGVFVARTIMDRKFQNQLHNKDFAILYRTNSQSRAMEDALRKKNIPYRVYGGLSFYQRKEVKDLLAYYRLVINPADEEAFRRVVNYPARGIGTTSLEKLTIASRQANLSLFDTVAQLPHLDSGLNNSAANKFNDFCLKIKSFQAMLPDSDAYDLAEHIAKSAGLLTQLHKDKTPEGISRFENVQELLNGIKEYTEKAKLDLEEGNPLLGGFMEDVALLTDRDNDDDTDKDKVALMTIHLSKGLEFPHVFVVGLEENLFPSMMAMNSRTELEEERRLFYVALTRSESEATFSFAEQRYRWGKLLDCEPSRFIKEVDESYLDFLYTESDSINETVQRSPDDWGEAFSSGTPTKKYEGKMPPKRNAESPQIKVAVPANLKKVSTNSPTSEDSAIHLDLAIGDKVGHERFGVGLISEFEGDGPNLKASITFKSGEKKLLLRFAKLKKL
ncbi:MAG: DNA helicase-2/ATP-dependent DNA helicase PcrA [Flavobacteriales bacterium]